MTSAELFQEYQSFLSTLRRQKYEPTAENLVILHGFLEWLLAYEQLAQPVKPLLFAFDAAMNMLTKGAAVSSHPPITP